MYACRREHLKIHMRTHEAEKPYPCALCHHSYPTVSALTSHMLTSHKADHVISDEMEEVGNKENEGEVMCVTQEAPRAVVGCGHCILQFPSMDLLQQHMEQVHGGGALSRVGMAGTLSRVGMPVLSPADDNISAGNSIHTVDSLAEVTHNDVITEAIQCPLCLATMTTADQLYIHIKQHQTQSKGVVSNSLTSKCLQVCKSKDKRSNTGKHQCSYCSKKPFSTSHALELHVQTMHLGVKDHLFACNFCHLAFSSSDRLMDHIRLEHPKTLEPPEIQVKYPCEHCPVEFTNPESLRMHRDSVHAKQGIGKMAAPSMNNDVIKMAASTMGNDVIICSQCSMGFTNIYALAEHMHSTHGYKGAGQISPEDLTMATNETDTSKMPSPGSASGHRLKSPASSSGESSKLADGRASTGLITNIMLGTESYTCDHCNATFADFKSYQCHVKNHVGDGFAKYTCPQCQAEFTNEGQMETHLLVHFLALATEYGCTSCMKLFGKPDELQKHLMDIHAHHLYR